MEGGSIQGWHAGDSGEEHVLRTPRGGFRPRRPGRSLSGWPRRACEPPPRDGLPKRPASQTTRPGSSSRPPPRGSRTPEEPGLAALSDDSVGRAGALPAPDQSVQQALYQVMRTPLGAMQSRGGTAASPRRATPPPLLQHLAAHFLPPGLSAREVQRLDPAYYSASRLLTRDSHRFDPRVRGLLSDLWALACSLDERSPEQATGVSKRAYTDFLARCAAAVIGNSIGPEWQDTDETRKAVVAALRREAERDWAEDSQRRPAERDWAEDSQRRPAPPRRTAPPRQRVPGEMSRLSFQYALFQLADTWTESCDVAEYCAFLAWLRESVSVRSESGSTSLRPLLGVWSRATRGVDWSGMMDRYAPAARWDRRRRKRAARGFPPRRRGYAGTRGAGSTARRAGSPPGGGRDPRRAARSLRSGDSTTGTPTSGSSTVSPEGPSRESSPRGGDPGLTLSRPGRDAASAVAGALARVLRRSAAPGSVMRPAQSGLRHAKYLAIESALRDARPATQRGGVEQSPTEAAGTRRGARTEPLGAEQARGVASGANASGHETGASGSLGGRGLAGRALMGESSSLYRPWSGAADSDMEDLSVHQGEAGTGGSKEPLASRAEAAAVRSRGSESYGVEAATVRSRGSEGYDVGATAVRSRESEGYGVEAATVRSRGSWGHSAGNAAARSAGRDRAAEGYDVGATAGRSRESEGYGVEAATVRSKESKGFGVEAATVRSRGSGGYDVGATAGRSRESKDYGVGATAVRSAGTESERSVVAVRRPPRISGLPSPGGGAAHDEQAHAVGYSARRSSQTQQGTRWDGSRVVYDPTPAAASLQSSSGHAGIKGKYSTGAPPLAPGAGSGGGGVRGGTCPSGRADRRVARRPVLHLRRCGLPGFPTAADAKREPVAAPHAPARSPPAGLVPPRGARQSRLGTARLAEDFTGGDRTSPFVRVSGTSLSDQLWLAALVRLTLRLDEGGRGSAAAGVRGERSAGPCSQDGQPLSGSAPGRARGEVEAGKENEAGGGGAGGGAGGGGEKAWSEDGSKREGGRDAHSGGASGAGGESEGERGAESGSDERSGGGVEVPGRVISTSRDGGRRGAAEGDGPQPGSPAWPVRVPAPAQEVQRPDDGAPPAPTVQEEAAEGRGGISAEGKGETPSDRAPQPSSSFAPRGTGRPLGGVKAAAAGSEESAQKHEEEEEEEEKEEEEEEAAAALPLARTESAHQERRRRWLTMHRSETSAGARGPPGTGKHYPPHPPQRPRDVHFTAPTKPLVRQQQPRRARKGISGSVMPVSTALLSLDGDQRSDSDAAAAPARNAKAPARARGPVHRPSPRVGSGGEGEGGTLPGPAVTAVRRPALGPRAESPPAQAPPQYRRPSSSGLWTPEGSVPGHRPRVVPKEHVDAGRPRSPELPTLVASGLSGNVAPSGPSRPVSGAGASPHSPGAGSPAGVEEPAPSLGIQGRGCGGGLPQRADRPSGPPVPRLPLRPAQPLSPTAAQTLVLGFAMEAISPLCAEEERGPASGPPRVGRDHAGAGAESPQRPTHLGPQAAQAARPAATAVPDAGTRRSRMEHTAAEEGRVKFRERGPRVRRRRRQRLARNVDRELARRTVRAMRGGKSRGGGTARAERLCRLPTDLLAPGRTALAARIAAVKHAQEEDGRG